MKIELTLEIEQYNNGNCVGRCLELEGVITQGKDVKECTDNLKDAITAMLTYKRLTKFKRNYNGNTSMTTKVLTFKLEE